MKENNIDYMQVKAVSNSSLSFIEKNPKEFKKFIDGEYVEEKTNYYELGTAIHSAILEPKNYKEIYSFMDYAAPRSPNQKKFCELYSNNPTRKDNKLIEMYSECYSCKGLSEQKTIEEAKSVLKDNADYLKYLKKSQKGVILSTSDENMISSILSSIKEHKKASNLLFNIYADVIADDNIFAENEIEIYWEDKQKIPYKSKIDRLYIDFKNKVVQIIDLKTTAKIDEFEKSIENYNYDRQLAFYKIAVYNLFKQKFENQNLEEFTFEFFIVAVSKQDYRVKVYKVTESTINSALNKIYSLLDRVKWHFENNKWDYYLEYYTNDGVIEI